MKPLSKKIFDGMRAECDLKDELETAGVEFEDVGWDDYDNSLELHGVPADFRLSEIAQQVIFDAGFSKAYVNHVDKWETHYDWGRPGPFSASKGWRVSYPHKRGTEEKSIWVEEPPKSWPKSWIESGYVLIKKLCD